MRKLSRSTLTLAVAGLAGTLLLGACQTSGPTRKENMLSAAGCKMVVADTPDKLASLQKLPPNRFQPKTINGQTMFLYADPVVCRCLYVGSQTAFQTYQGMAFDERISTTNLLAAQMNSDAVWDYGVWGPIWW